MPPTECSGVIINPTDIVKHIVLDVVEKMQDCETINDEVEMETDNQHQVSAKDLQQDIRCPVCLDIPKSAPIYTCLNGHLVCNACHPSMNNECPVCRIELGNNRNIFAEKVLSKLPIPCKFYSKGCTFQLIDRQILERHEEECTKGAILCIRMDCDKKIPISKFVGHMKTEHNITGREEVPFDGLMEFEYTLFSRPKQWQEQYFQMDGMHFYSELIRLDKGLWFAWVYHLKTINVQKRFRWTYSLLAEQSDERVDFHGDCVSLEDISVASMTNAEQSCLIFSDATVKKFAPEGKLQFKIDIYEQTTSRDNSFNSSSIISTHSILE